MIAVLFSDILTTVINMNVCKFVSTQKHDDSINIINFVYEKEADFKKEYLISSTYTMGLVTGGNGLLHTHSGTFPIGEGDIFMTFPAKAYYIENLQKLQYIYVSFTGIRAQTLIQRVGLSYTEPVYHNFGFLKESWENILELSTDSNCDLFCEALILNAFGYMCRNNEERSFPEKTNNILLAKQYVDLNFTDSDINLKTVSEKFSYNPKYFSAAFKRMVRINFSEYLRIKRLGYAVSLIESGITNANDLAELCGYKEPLYFSKSFKAYYGVSPKNWIKQ